MFRFQGGKSWNNSVPSIWLESGYTGVDNTYPRQQAKQIMMANEYSWLSSAEPEDSVHLHREAGRPGNEATPDVLGR